MKYEKRRTIIVKRAPVPRVSGQAARLRGGGADPQLSSWEDKKLGYCIIRHAGLDPASINANEINPLPNSNNSHSSLRIQPSHTREGKFAAFTLAEVLITLGIIGVVAAITMPALMNNVNERVNSHRQANIAYKITQATDKMKTMGLLNESYASTDQFVDELQKHLKIIKRCDASHIADCWPTDKVTLRDGTTYEVKNAVTGAELKVFSNTTDNVGLVLADGASIILTYNHNSQGMDMGDVIKASTKSLPIGFGKSQDFAYTTNTTASIDFVMDVNGKKGPNSETTMDNKMHDIRSFKVARFGLCDIKIPGIGCVVNLGGSYECLEPGSDEQKKWDNTTMPADGVGGKYCFGGARKACDDIGMSLPSKETLSSIYKMIPEYPQLPQSGDFWSSTLSDNNYIWHGYQTQGVNSTVNKYSAMCIGN